MLHIAICDDVVEETLFLQKYIKEYCINNHVEMKLRIYITGKALLENAGEIDILFLDIGMPETDGITIGRKVREKNSSCRIIMATCMVERMKEAFYIEAFRFITKPFSRGEVEEALDACMKKLLGSETLILYYERNAYEIRQSEIWYIVTYDSYCEYRIKDKILRSETSLRELEKQLDTRVFFRIHRKYIVNLSKISDYKNGSIQLADITLPVSRRRKKEFERAYMEFDLKYR